MPDTPDTTAVQASEQWPALDPIEAGTVAAVGARLGWSEIDALAAGGELAAWFDLHT
jgi:hypothetical protein